MPRRTSTRGLASASSTPVASSPAPALPGPPLSPDLALLRQQWKWAAFSQFFFTFAPLFNMEDVSLADIEDDLSRSLNLVLPRVMQRLLYTLTQDRKLSPDTWQTVLRKQYAKRDPDANPLGPEPVSDSPESSPVPTREPSIEPGPGLSDVVSGDATDGMQLPNNASNTGLDVNGASEENPHAADSPIPFDEPKEQSHDWRDLPMLAKLESMHTVAEWHFQNPTRLRMTMKSDDEYAQWRIEPIGYDAKTNAYWLIGYDRLWIQRAQPKPRNLKRKRAPANNKQASNSTGSSKHNTAQQSSSKKKKRVEIAPPVTAGGRSSRAAKMNANIKLDAQAKQLAEYQRQAALDGKRGSPSKASPARPMGTRVSARLRGPIAEEEWQPVPEEWLAEDDAKGSLTPSKRTAKPPTTKTGLESDAESVSDLTDLSSEVEKPNSTGKAAQSDKPIETTTRLPDNAGEDEPAVPSPGAFIEWETIAVTLYEWEHIADQFQNSHHYAEKHLYKVLSNTIVPAVTEELKEIERKRKLEEAIVHRKRSSRIAIKESEKEEAIASAKKRAEEDEKMSRARRLEARQQKEEAERVKRETAREQRRQEREDRERRHAELQERAASNARTGSREKSQPNGRRRTNGVEERPRNGGGSATGGTRTPAEGDWEVDCEICHRKGVNQDDGVPMMCCGGCNKWQHIVCHDRVDLQAGRPKRNWDTEDFICQRCRANIAPRAVSSHPPQQAKYREGSRVPNGYSHPLPPMQNGRSVGHSLGPQQRPYQEQSAIAFTHYQPQQHGFTPPPQSRQFAQEPAYRSEPPFRPEPAYRPEQAYRSDPAYHQSQGYPYVAPPTYHGQHSPAPAPHPYSPHPPVHAPSQWNGAPSYPTHGGGHASYASRPEAGGYGSPIGGGSQSWQQSAHNGGLPPQYPPQHTQFRYHEGMGSTSHYPPS